MKFCLGRKAEVLILAAGKRGSISPTRPFGEGWVGMNVQDDSARDLRSLARWRATARVLVEALPFILAYDNKTIVVKYGGHAMEEGVPTEFAQDILPNKQTGVNPGVGHRRRPPDVAQLK